MVPRSEALALVIAGIVAIIGIIVCAVAKVDVPGVLGDLAFVAVGGGAGAARSGTLPAPVAPAPPVGG